MNRTPLRRKSVALNRLELVARSEEFQDDREPPLSIGNVVRLNSGGPRTLVVDLPDEKSLTISWRDPEGSVQEASLPRDCFHRIDLFG
jgi:uncharacterized protein YodC (DUF2158 family)